MWVSSKIFDWLRISKDYVDGLSEELKVTRAELNSLQDKYRVMQINSDWFRMKVNQLEMEKTALLELAYKIKLPTPQLMKQPTPDPTFDPKNFSFADVGEEMAKQLGLPSYDTNYHDAH